MHSFIGVYGLENEGILSPFFRGLENAGFAAKWRRHDVFTPDQGENFSSVVVNGLRKHYKTVQQTYLERGVPVIVTDRGYVRKDCKYYQVGFQNLGWIPEFECPKDRFNELEIPYPGNKSDKKGFILVAGQMPGDAAHEYDAPTLEKLYNTAIEELRAAYPSNKIVWRPHPMAKDALRVTGYDSISQEDEFIDALPGCFFVATINSTSGIEALTAGYPVLCKGNAFYVCVASTLMDNIVYPTKEAYESFFSKLAYAQWTLTEIENGLAATFIFNALKGIPPVINENVLPLDEQGVSENETELPESEPAATKTGNGRARRRDSKPANAS